MDAMTQAELQRRIKAVGIADHWPYGANNPETRDRLLDWAEPLQLRYSEAGTCLHWIAKGRCAVQTCQEHARSRSWLDHVSGWTRSGKPALLVAQPYGLDQDQLRDILGAAEQFGLEPRIDGTGWYGNGSTFLSLAPKSK
ncbi:hypothetical protein Ae505Ps2_6235 [Pseudonocardia sp. Ae505_Ps2]|nr:hypothetical protein Ae505Ps2_6235 [Pseudonocardia sp. Ae505_Ps2]